MTTKSDLAIESSRFLPENISEATKQANNLSASIGLKGPQWYEVGAAKYREMHAQGQLTLPPPIYLPNAIDSTVPSRDTARSIPVRVYRPDKGPSKGVFLHYHGGGFVLGSEKSFDNVLQMYANGAQLTAISVGYRHAPEDPYPAPVHDCIDAAEYLVDHPLEHGIVRFVGGESSGACLSIIVAIHLLRSRPSHALSGIVLHYGLFDLSLSLPAMKRTTKPFTANVSPLEHLVEAYLPGLTADERRNPSISPLFDDLTAVAAASPNGLPSALFICGTLDPLLDDNLIMGMKWSIAGGEGIVKIYPGAPHAFTAFPGLDVAEEANTLSVNFVREKLGTVV
ncbi:hypothetical protein BDV06DRAFT_216876 [Aspergillus oleicola]